jgi:hypothetical protein
VTYDQFFKRLFRTCWEELLELFYPELLEDYEPEPVEWVERQLPVDPARNRYREVDLLARLRPKDPAKKERLVGVEVQARRKARFIQRVHLYYTLIHYMENRPVTFLVIYLEPRGTGWDREVLDESEGDMVVRFGCRRISLGKSLAADYLAKGNALGWGLTAFMDPVGLSRAWLKAEALKRLRERDLEEAKRQVLVDCIETYLVLNEAEQSEYAVLLRQEEYKMVINIEDIKETWLERIEREAWERGQAEGQAQSKRETLLRLLRHKFHDVPVEVDRRVQGLSVADLDRLLEGVLDANSLTDLGLDGAKVERSRREGKAKRP